MSMSSSIMGHHFLLPAAAAIISSWSSSRSFHNDEDDGNFRSFFSVLSTSSFAKTTTTTTTCEGAASTPSTAVLLPNRTSPLPTQYYGNKLFAPPLPETILRRKMTAVGRFSLKSETEHNRSIPTFFLALSGEKKKKNSQLLDSSSSSSSLLRENVNNIFTVSDFEEAWLTQDMPWRHPRFHSTVCPQQHYFEERHHIIPPPKDGSKQESKKIIVDKEDGSSTDVVDPIMQIKAELHNHASETMHYAIYRHDLRNRLEHMLTSPINVSEKLWEVQISNGILGSSGAISRAKVDHILKKDPNQVVLSLDKKRDGDDFTKKEATKTSGVWWNTNTHRADHHEMMRNTIPMESVLLFRSHHALADGASIMAALSDLCDEAEEIRSEIQMKLNKWKHQRDETKFQNKSFLRRIFSRILRLLKMCAWMTFGTLQALLYQGYLQITTPRNPFDAVRRDAERKGLTLHGRSISWCDAASLDEVKQVAKVIGKSKGVDITVNDLFVSCVTSAVTRQLIEHEEFMSPLEAHKRKFVVPNINVVVPVHLGGGVILPGQSVGNNIGAFVTRCPGEMTHDAVGGGMEPCPTERLVRVHKSLSYSKRSPAPVVSYYMAKFCSTYLPDGVTQRIFQSANANAAVVVSNNRGYDKKMHIRGMAVESAAGFVPLPPGIPIGVVVQSYAGMLSLSVTAEKWAVPDADKFLRWILDEYQRLHEAASKVQG